MCPGVTVAAGGGGGGGGSGKGSKKGKGKKGKGGRSGRRRGSGGRRNGRNQGGCGRGRGCTGRHPERRGQASRGHPVDVITGKVFTDPVAMVAFGGPLSFRLDRSYSTEARGRDVGLGPGWTHGLAFTLAVHRGHVDLVTDHGILLDLPALAVDEAAVCANGWLLSRDESGYLLDTHEDRFYRFVPSEADGRHVLSAVLDAYGNRLALEYDEDGRLTRVVDAGGRDHRFAWEGTRLVATYVRNAPVDGQWVELGHYHYDEAGRLVVAVDQGAHAYAYDPKALLVEHTGPDEVTYHFRYDEAERCVETWGDCPDEARLGLDPEVPAVLADGLTKARGILHAKFTYGPDGFCEVASSLTVERYFGDEDGRVTKAVGNAGVTTQVFDATGNVIELTDAVGATYRWRRDERGLVVEETDPLGRTTRIERDETGGLHRIVDPAGGVTEVHAFPSVLQWVDPVGGVYEERRDARGQVVEVVAANGARVRYEYDDAGHLRARIDADGQVTKLHHDTLGQLVSRTDADGGFTSWSYDDSGRVRSAVSAAGTTTHFRYDAAGALAGRDDDGRRTEYRFGALDNLLSVTEPDGSEVRLLYDREGRLVRMIDGIGREHRFVRNVHGLVVEETTFDGRSSRHRYDPVGRLVHVEDQAGRITEYEWDLAGQLVATRQGDEEHTFEYDLLGNVVRAVTPTSAVHLVRDAAGRVVREEQHHAGEVFVVERTLDAIGDERELRFAGHVLRFERDVFGRTTAVDLGGVRVAVDHGRGDAQRRRLPGGGVIEQWSEVGREVLRGLDAQGALSFERTSRYDDRGDLRAWDDSSRGPTTFAWDAAGRLAEAASPAGTSERFAYDAAGNRCGEGERLDAHGRLVETAEATYAWDDAGRLVEKTLRADGSTTRYRWTETGWLAAVVGPDGREVRFAYDAWARRVRKTVRGPDGELERDVRYGWFGDRLLAEWTEDVSGTRRRAFCHDDDGAPFAQHTSDGAARWAHVVVDPITSAPDRLVDDDGRVIARLDRSAWGVVQGSDDATPFGFAGQIHDPETGLFGNRFRTYDPAIGRYLSPDPLGPDADLNAYRYADNRPTGLVDPLGLFPTSTYRRPDGTTFQGYSAGETRTDGSTPVRDPAIRGAVQNARRNVERDGGSPGTTFGRCAEVDALHRRASEIRAERQTNGTAFRNPRRENAAIRSRIRSELAVGRGAGRATLTTVDSRGRNMNPCAHCHQILREMGCHPRNRPATGCAGVMGGDGRPFDGRVDHTGTAVRTVPATTPSIPATRPGGEPEIDGYRNVGPRESPAQRTRFIPAETPRDTRRERQQGRQ